MGKQLVDAEDLVVWAAGELARKRPGKSAPRATFNLGRADRELVGKWSAPMGFPPMSPMFAAGLGRIGGAHADPPHDDALIVEDALGRLKLCAPSLSIDDAELAFGLGFPVDTAGAVRAALANVANLLLVHGRLGNRPPLRLEPPEPAARLAANGKPGVWRCETWAEPTFADHAQAIRDVEVACVAKRKGLYPTGAYCIVEWTPDPQELVNERAEYAAWRAGLERLAAELAGELESRAVLPPRAAARPWLSERDGEPVRDLYGPGAERVLSRDEAGSMAARRALGARRPPAGATVYARAPAKPARGVRKA